MRQTFTLGRYRPEQSFVCFELSMATDCWKAFLAVLIIRLSGDQHEKYGGGNGFGLRNVR
jgi:hypothetical protein